MEKTTDVILFNSSDGNVSLPVAIKSETVWLSLDQIAALFQRDKSTISRHIRNVFKENELERSATVAKFATVQEEGSRQVEREIDYFNRDVIISLVWSKLVDYSARCNQSAASIARY